MNTVRHLWQFWWGKAVLVVAGFLLYLVSTVPVGLFLYSVKSGLGIDIFTYVGFHSYIACLNQESGKALKRIETHF